MGGWKERMYSSSYFLSPVLIISLFPVQVNNIPVYMVILCITSAWCTYAWCFSTRPCKLISKRLHCRSTASDDVICHERMYKMCKRRLEAETKNAPPNFFDSAQSLNSAISNLINLTASFFQYDQRRYTMECPVDAPDQDRKWLSA